MSTRIRELRHPHHVTVSEGPLALRLRVARAWRLTVRDAHRPAGTRSTVSIVHCRAVVEAEDAIDGLIARLTDADPIAAEGMALVEGLITDGTSSPLYNAAEPGTLRRRVLLAAETLDPEPRELPAAAWSADPARSRTFDAPICERIL
jgi:hypothetical protein